MVRGVGLDVVDVAAFTAQVQDGPSSFVEVTFTRQERADCDASRDRVRSLAARWAAKEAFLKAWAASRRGDEPAQDSPKWHEIEVALDPWRRPTLLLHGETARLAARPRCHLSLSHDGGIAAAVVILEEAP